MKPTTACFVKTDIDGTDGVRGASRHGDRIAMIGLLSAKRATGGSQTIATGTSTRAGCRNGLAASWSPAFRRLFQSAKAGTPAGLVPPSTASPFLHLRVPNSGPTGPGLSRVGNIVRLLAEQHVMPSVAWALPFPGADCFTGGRHSGVCLLHWCGLHLETGEPLPAIARVFGPDRLRPSQPGRAGAGRGVPGRWSTAECRGCRR